MPSPPPSEKQWDRDFAFLEEQVLYSEWDHDTNAYIDLIFALGHHVIGTWSQTVDRGFRRRILGFQLAGSFFDCSKVLPLHRILI